LYILYLIVLLFYMYVYIIVNGTFSLYVCIYYS
jgi:hypothetical protein